jgi:hypothetical protein
MQPENLTPAVDERIEIHRDACSLIVVDIWICVAAVGSNPLLSRLKG